MRKEKDCTCPCHEQDKSIMHFMPCCFPSEDEIQEDQLYVNLKLLTETNEAFFTREFEENGMKYEIFLYRLASRTDFEAPDALKARGTMFIDGKCVSRPMPKFFNMEEELGYLDIDLEEYTIAMDKLDGSLISTYIDPFDNSLKLKSKGSITSIQAIMAIDVLNSNFSYFNAIRRLAERGYTVNFELTSPSNRIVVGYDDTRLTILNIIDENFNYATKDNLLDSNPSDYDWPIINDNWVEYHDDIHPDDVKDMVLHKDKFIEGFVFVNKNNGHLIKCKTARYVELHSAKDGITNRRKFVECLLNDGSDDLRTLFRDDAVVLDYIKESEKRVFSVYNSTVAKVERSVVKDGHMSRKDFAIKYKGSPYFSLMIKLYQAIDPDYKQFLVKQRDQYFSFLDNQCQ